MRINSISPGTAGEMGALAELVVGPQGAIIIGSDFLIDGGDDNTSRSGVINSQD